MAKIKYRLYSGVGEWSSLNDDDRTQLIIDLSANRLGYISLGKGIYRVENGVAKITLNTIEDGVYEPRFECDEGVFLLEGFTKSGNNISMLPTSEENIRLLIKRCRSAESRLHDLENQVKELNKKTEGHHIFG